LLLVDFTDLVITIPRVTVAQGAETTAGAETTTEAETTAGAETTTEAETTAGAETIARAAAKDCC
jgi:hypothetical protein